MDIEIVEVNLEERSYDIRIGYENPIERDLRRFSSYRPAIITDSNVKEEYGDRLVRLLQLQGLDAQLLPFSAGEASKTEETKEWLEDELSKRGYDRESIILALGGGVVGDLAGYVAATYCEGIPYIQIPTTLLAQVDSSIGGKVGVNTKEGKNLIREIYQPKAVIIDIGTLKTLPEREIRNGLAEIIKYGVSQDRALFEYVEQSIIQNIVGTPEFYLHVITRCCEIKAKIVEKDETDTGMRQGLNYGHTIGHGIEAITEYTIPHGVAVALGMAYEGMISVKLGFLAEEDLERQNRVISAVGLPIVYEGEIDIEELIEVMKRDKKGELHFVLPTAIGSVREENGQFAFPVDEQDIIECLTKSLSS